MAHKVVLIHIGDIFYSYINQCINQIKKFTDSEIILLTSVNHFSLIKNEVKLIPIESIDISKKHKHFLNSFNLNSKFRGGFWRYTSQRFFYLEDVVNKYNIENIFHFENDVLIYNDLNIIEDLLIQNNIEAASTFDNDNRCIPGYNYFRNNNIISNLTEYILNESGKKNDMEMLSNFSKAFDSFKYLPVIPNFYSESLISIDGFGSKIENKYSENFQIFNSVFDAAAIGQYLGGVDPRNGKIKENFINESAIYQANKFTYKWEIDAKGRNCPYIIYKNKFIKVNNLHIHSKRLNEFV